MWRCKYHEDFEKIICSKCECDINREYGPCMNCNKHVEFEKGYDACKDKMRDILKSLTDALSTSNDYYYADEIIKARKFLEED